MYTTCILVDICILSVLLIHCWAERNIEKISPPPGVVEKISPRRLIGGFTVGNLLFMSPDFAGRTSVLKKVGRGIRQN